MSKFFVVRDPICAGPDMEFSDVMMEFTTSEHARYVIGCGLARYDQERHSVHLTRESAVADVMERIDKLGVSVERLIAQLHGRTPFDRNKNIQQFIGSLPNIQLWAALRGRVSLSEVVDMVGQDLEASPGDTDEAQSMADRLARLIDKADGE